MLAVAGMPGRYLLLLVAGALLVVLVALKAAYCSSTDRTADQLHLDPRPEKDTYNVNQAKEAIATAASSVVGSSTGPHQPGLRA